MTDLALALRTSLGSSIKPIAALLLGITLGVSLSRIGFTSFQELHAMLTFANLRLMYVFVGALAGSGVALWLLRHRRQLPPKPLSKRVIVGGVLFGVGWALSGACPGVVFAQLGEGKVWALLTLFGVVLGTALTERLTGAPPEDRADACG
jgi:uncharacterized membrane protein YedE/YeeE